MDNIPEYIYSVRDIFINKKICMVNGKNTIVVVYEITTAERGCTLKIAPLVNFRDYHFNSYREHLKFSQTEGEKGTILKPENFDLDFYININSGKYIKKDEIYFYNMEYEKELERGLNSVEDHYIPGIFEVDIEPHMSKVITVTAGVGEWEELDGIEVIKAEEKRLEALTERAGYRDEFANKLVKACDQFIVERESTGSKTIIAGYPWFTDWGRDTMIALPGITIMTKRFDDAKDILYTFSKYIRKGLVPNMFPDAGHEPIYNTVDASLWYFYAIYKYVKYTGDYSFIEQNILSGMLEIIENYKNGTCYNIKMDDDSLIYAGDEKTQLTWMDAKVGDWVVTPRHGKAVEINALWYNALMVMGDICKNIGRKNAEYLNLASQVKTSFEHKFWNEEEQCLYDIVDVENVDASIRPNQIFAVSLDFPVIDGNKAKKIVNKVFDKLYATYGLRSLSADCDQYKGRYIGGQLERDGAYHQGTCWSWLIGHFVSAYRKAYEYSKESEIIVEKIIEPFKDHLNDACIGSISEIFDGESPNIPRGCFAQAWGVAEVLRAYVEDIS
jgi:predicted glycogen debranching enzyme